MKNMKKNTKEKLFISRFIKVDTEPVYIDEESEPDNNQYFWAYHITISNQSVHKVTLKRRNWVITDSNGVESIVNGKGVVGKQPDLNPGESFSYTSGAMLSAPSGIMKGRYDLETPEGKIISVEIPAFSLDSPHESRIIT
jgi:ApaG protein